MEIPVEVIKYIYLHDETMYEGDYFRKSVATKNYTKSFNEILMLTTDNPISNKKLFELDSLDGERLAEVELMGYTKGFLTCMKIMNDNKLRLSSNNEKAQ